MPTAAPDVRRCGRPPRTRDSTTAHTRARTSKGTAAMRIAVGSDHAGFHLKEHVKSELAGLGHDVRDVGLAANKVGGRRGINAHDPPGPEMPRRHNDVNVVTLSGSRLGPREADAI